jgi:hypothetical protein
LQKLEHREQREQRIALEELLGAVRRESGTRPRYPITASRRFVFTRSPGFFGMSEGAATVQSWPSFPISR